MHNIKEKLLKWFPFILTIFVILFIGLSMIGPFYEIKEKIGGMKLYYNFSLPELLFSNLAGIEVQLFFIFTYLILPILACILLLLSRIKKDFAVGALLIFLMLGLTSIVAKDVFIYRYLGILGGRIAESCSINQIYFSSILSSIVYFIAFALIMASISSATKFSIRDLTEMGILVAIALALNFVKLFPAPTGGSVNLQMLPLFILAIRRGPLKGFIAGGIVYGLISCLTDGYGIATFPFDYLLGFGSICILGFFSKAIFDQKDGYSVKGELFLLLGGLLATFVRFIGGTISSMVLYGYQLVPAMSYNSLYVFISGGIALAVVMALYGPIKRVNKLYPVEKQ